MSAEMPNEASKGSAALAQYIFLDVVRFTQGRTIEAQVDVIEALNRVVREALEEYRLGEHSRILLPTGDGIAIAILEPEPFDLALRVAESIMTRLYKYNQNTTDSRRKFEVRVGINQNIDNIIIDINGGRNVAGRGINMAQRIMSHAEGSQILVGETVYDILCEREAYADAFRELPCRDKHGNRFRAFQLKLGDLEGVNTELPSWMKPAAPSSPQRMSAYEAHFITNAAYHSSFLMDKRKDSLFEYSSVLLLHILALDSMDNIRRHALQERSDRTKLLATGSLVSKYDQIKTSEFWTCAEFAEEIYRRLNSDNFEHSDTYTVFWAFPSERGRDRVKTEAQEVWSHIFGKLNVGESE